MKTKLIVAILLFVTQVNAIAQKDYALTVSGDTLKGEIRILSMDNIDRVQVVGTGKKSNYTALQIRSVTKDGAFYKPVKYENSIRFMKIIKSGYLSICAFTLPGQSGWDGRYLTKNDGTGIEVPNLAFKKFVSSYLSDCPEIKSRIEKGDLVKRDLEKIIDMYNICIQAKTDRTATVKPAEVSVDSEKILALKELSKKIDAENFSSKNDALDLLKDIQSKVSKNEKIPNYLTEGLKSYLSSVPTLSKSLDEVLALLKK